MELGLRHFDTAPSYGDGIAEEMIGRCFRARRHEIVVATKAGILPRSNPARHPLLLPLQRGMGYLLHLRSRVPARPPITPHSIRRSLHSSLRRLGTDYVDLFMLHEPSADILEHPQEVVSEMHKLIRDGYTRHIGLAGRWETLQHILQQVPDESLVLQTHENDWPESQPPTITYGVLSSGKQSFLGQQRLRKDEAHAKLARALRRRPQGMVLLSTTNPNHLLEITSLAADLA